MFASILINIQCPLSLMGDIPVVWEGWLGVQRPRDLWTQPPTVWCYWTATLIWCLRLFVKLHSSFQSWDSSLTSPLCLWLFSRIFFLQGLLMLLVVEAGTGLLPGNPRLWRSWLSMPWSHFLQCTDCELGEIFMYLVPGRLWGGDYRCGSLLLLPSTQSFLNFSVAPANVSSS